MNITSKVLFFLAILVVILTMLMDVTETQETIRRRGGRRRTSNRRRGGRRGGSRGRNRNRNTVSTTEATPGGSAAPEGCEEIYLPMCKGFIPYTHTKLPNKFNHTTQLQVYQEMEHLWAYMDHSCSVNTRQLLCALYLPRCNEQSQAEGPCRLTCMRAKRRCSAPFDEMFGLTWSQRFSCRGLPRLRCVRPARESRCNRPYPTCVDISTLPGCSGLTFTYGTLPNMFQQCHEQQISTEMEYFAALRQSNCHPNLDFLLCGVYSPYCIRTEVPFTFPCQEICNEIRSSCERPYQSLYHNLPWPNKLQCHRYPGTNSTDGRRCVMPNEGNIFGGGK